MLILVQVPGAWVMMNGEKVILLGSSRWNRKVPKGREIEVTEIPDGKVIAHERGLLLPASDGKWVCRSHVKILIFFRLM